jgi:hypothetical protein
MTTDTTKYLVKTSTQFHCEKCNYYTSRKFNFELHINSNKHKNTKITTENNETLVKVSKITKCLNCGKIFNDRAGLWRHKQKCIHNIEDRSKNNTEVKENDINKKDELIDYLIKENQEFKNLILEIIKKDTYNTNNINNSNTNSHNKTFNLQLFLNETCKDAMNITDFVDSIQLQLSDLENVGRVGYVNGISKIIIKSLNALDETKRPIHCTDTKREVLYVKDENIWQKDNDKKCVKKAIKRVANKNCKLLLEFREKHPDCNKSDSRYSDQYNKMIVEAMGGSGNNDAEKEDKIIQNISKEVQINKSDTSLSIFKNNI